MTTENKSPETIKAEAALKEMDRKLSGNGAALAKARAVRSENIRLAKEAKASGVTISPEARDFVPQSTAKELWLKVFLNYMQTCEIRGPKDVPTIIERTDATIAILKDAGKI
jgi:hypothetical protein